MLKLSVVEETHTRPHRTARHARKAWVAEDGLPVGGDCTNHEFAESPTLDQALAKLSRQVENPYSHTVQFYSTGGSKLLLPAGTYNWKVYKGPEYKVLGGEIQVRAGETVEKTVEISRWINMPQLGWYSSDDHIHIARPLRELNPIISKFMQAEDIHVANLLQWGHSKYFHNAPQYAHGPAGHYRESDYLLAAGQENPRTNILGHTIILGAKSPINTEAYVIYRLFWEEAQRQKALSGYAHYGFGSALSGLGIDLPLRLINFMEVLQFNTGFYDVWYETLNTGFRLTPTAGTDYPCGNTVPGHDRFYTKVESPLTYDTWLEGVRLGRTFVTNGPMLEFRVNRHGMGEEVVLNKPGSVLLEGRVRFDPSQDIVFRLQVIENGNVLRSILREEGQAELAFRFRHELKEDTWLAVRATGKKWPLWDPAVDSEAHSAPIYVKVEGSPGLWSEQRAKEAAQSWITRLERLEKSLADDHIQNLAPWNPGWDGVDTDHVRENRPALIQAIQSAKKYFMEQARWPAKWNVLK